MIIRSENGAKEISVGSPNVMLSLYSTIVTRTNYQHLDIDGAIDFLRSGKCSSAKALIVARQFNVIRDRLSEVKPEEVVLDYTDPSKRSPLLDDLSPVVTSCGNIFLTEDGEDLLFEIVSILTYSYYSKSDVVIE